MEREILEFICIGCEEMWDEEHLNGGDESVCILCDLPLFQRIDGCSLPTPIHVFIDNALA